MHNMTQLPLDAKAGLIGEAMRRHEAKLTPGMRRIALYLRDNVEIAMVSSALELAQLTESSDASVIRTIKALGFAGLPDMRRALGKSFRARNGSAPRMSAALEKMPRKLEASIGGIIGDNMRSLTRLEEPGVIQQLAYLSASLASAERIVIFAQGSARAMGLHFYDVLVRFGFRVLLISGRGADLVDQMLQMSENDVTLMIVVGRKYAEAEIFLNQQNSRALFVLGNDTASWRGHDRIDHYIDVASASGHILTPKVSFFLALEAILGGMATQRPQAVTGTLSRLDELRAIVEKARRRL